MSEFFEGLAARSAGTATALRPRVASAYETRDAIEVVEEVPATTPAVILPSSREVRVAESMPIDSPTDPAEPMVVRNVVLTRTETRDAPAVEAAREVRVDERVEAHVEERVEERAEQRVERAREHPHEHTHHEERRIERVRELLAASHEQPPDRRADPPAESHGSLAAEQGPAEQRASPLPAAERRPFSRRDAGVPLATADNRQPLVSSQPPADPIVRITIGRVEVRAVQPAQPAPRPAPQPVAAGPTLAEFLEQRERRK